MKTQHQCFLSLTGRTQTVVVVLGFLAGTALAQTRTWDGGGSADNSGNWSAAANWDGPDNTPDTSVENAELPDVSSGTRTVTVDAAHTIGQLKMTQTSGSGANKLVLDDTLLLTSTTPLSLTPTAGLASLVLDVNGKTLVTSNNNYTATLDGTVKAGPGSLLDFALNNNQGGLHINNLGVFEQNNSTSFFNFAVSSLNNDTSGIGRSFFNAGTWTLTNNAAFLLTLIGVTSSPPGYGLLAGCTNTGTLRVVDGSTCTFETLDSSGTLELGANSVLGNGDSTLRILNGSVFNVTGTNAFVGRAPSASFAKTATFQNSGTTTIGSVGNPADLILRDGTLILTNQVNGVITLSPESRLFMKYTLPFIFANEGVFMQDNAAVLFDWCNTANTTASRNFNNSGTWILKNGSQAISTSSVGRPLTWCLDASTNSGTLRVLSGSLLHVRTLTNSGTLELGTNSVLVGAELLSSKPILHNLGGTVVVSGTNTICGAATNETGSVTFNNGSASSSGGVFRIGDGTNTPTCSLMAGIATLRNFANNSVDIAAGATLAVGVFDDGIPHAFNTRYATIDNAGTLTLAGALQQQGNHAGNPPITNAGIFRVSGPAAHLELLAGASSNYLTPTLLNNAGALLTGAGTLTYTNRTGNATHKTLVVRNAGTIAPGNPAGTLELVNTAVTFTNGTLAIELSDAITSDKLKVSGTGAALTLTGTANVLDVSLVGVNQVVNYRIFEGGPLTGTFNTLLWKGEPAEGEYNVIYGADYIDLKYHPKGTLVVVR